MSRQGGSEHGRSPDKPFRVIATGLRGGRANIAFDQALIEARREERIPDTIRFLRFRPSALIGIHQYLRHEIKLDYCKAHGIETVRRITGGGGLYFDEGQIGWELVFDRASLGVTDLAEVTRRICEAAALGLQKLGVPARLSAAQRYRSRRPQDQRHRRLLRRQSHFLSGHIADRLRPGQDACLPQRAGGEARQARHQFGGATHHHDARSDGRRSTRSRDHLCRDWSPDLPKASASRRNGVQITAYEEELAERVFREEIGTDAYVTMLDAPPADDALGQRVADRPRRHRTCRYSP